MLNLGEPNVKKQKIFFDHNFLAGQLGDHKRGCYMLIIINS